MSLFIKIIAVFVWLSLYLLASIFLIIASVIAFMRGKQEQYFTQKPIFDPGKYKLS